MNLDTVHGQLRARMPDILADLRAKAADHGPLPREAGYTISNSAGDEAVVRIYDEIWWLGVNADDLAQDLADISAPRIRVEINSPGGDVFDGIAIFNALRNHPAYVTTRVDGIAASIASVIAQAGDQRIMVGGSQMMIHNAWGLTVGDHSDHEQMAALLAQQDAVIASIYATRSGRKVDEYVALMDAESWLTAQAAVDAGLADEVYEPPVQNRTATLQQQISAAADAVDVAVTAAERVVALRGEAGKTLSGVCVAGLDGLRGHLARVQGLLEPSTSGAAAPADVLVLAAANRRRRHQN